MKQIHLEGIADQLPVGAMATATVQNQDKTEIIPLIVIKTADLPSGRNPVGHCDMRFNCLNRDDEYLVAAMVRLNDEDKQTYASYLNVWNAVNFDFLMNVVHRELALIAVYDTDDHLVFQSEIHFPGDTVKSLILSADGFKKWSQKEFEEAVARAEEAFSGAANLWHWIES